jgi:SAM-dependent methyltransferase
VLTSAWIGAARVRQRIARLLTREPPRERLVAAHARGRSFADVGCMWGVDGAIAFAAEQAGAARVTGVDVMGPSAAYAAEHARRRSGVRFVEGDLHNPDVLDRVGRHDVVWCSGVIYHAPHPLLTLERLASITGEMLILSSETIPEVPGLPQACVFLPGLDARPRSALAGGRDGTLVGLTTPFDPRRGYANWYWGLTRSALRAMVAVTGLEVTEEHGGGMHVTLVARRIL